MKKLLYSLLALATIIFAAGCAQEKLVSPVGDGDTVTATFTVALPDAVATKAISDASQAEQLLFMAYDKNNKHLALDQTVKVEGKKATIDVALVTGVTYQFVFLAQKEGKFTPDADNAKLTVTPTAMMNDDSYDTFYARLTKDVTSSFNENVTLHRPFAQLNIGAIKADAANNVRGDFAAAEAAGIVTAATPANDGDPTLQTSYTIKVPTELNLLTGEVGAEAEFTLAAANRPSEELTVDGKAYDWVSMAYVLAGESKAVMDNVKLTLTTSQNGTPIELVREVPNVPYQANYRTNILGYIFSVKGTFEIIVDPNFYTPDYNVVISSQEELDEVIAGINAGTSSTTSLTLEADVDGTVLDFSGLDDALAVPVTIASPAAGEDAKTVVVENLESSLTGTKAIAVTVGENAKVILENAELTSTGDNTRAVEIESGADVVLSNVKMEVSGGTYNRCLQVDGTDANVTVTDSEIKSVYYPINLIGNSGSSTIKFENTTIEGWCILNIWSSGNTFEFKNCTLKSLNDKTYDAKGWNDFAAIVCNNDGTNAANDNNISIVDSNITVESTNGGNKQYLVSVRYYYTQAMSDAGESPQYLTGNRLTISGGNILGVNTNGNWYDNFTAVSIVNTNYANNADISAYSFIWNGEDLNAE